MVKTSMQKGASSGSKARRGGRKLANPKNLSRMTGMQAGPGYQPPPTFMPHHGAQPQLQQPQGGFGLQQPQGFGGLQLPQGFGLQPLQQQFMQQGQGYPVRGSQHGARSQRGARRSRIGAGFERGMY